MRLDGRDKIDDSSSLFSLIRFGIRFCVGAQHEQILKDRESERTESNGMPPTGRRWIFVVASSLPCQPRFTGRSFDGVSGYTR